MNASSKALEAQLFHVLHTPRSYDTPFRSLQRTSAEIFLDKGADVNRKFKAYSGKRVYPKHNHAHIAAATGDFDLLRSLLKHRADYTIQCDDNGQTLLHTIFQRYHGLFDQCYHLKQCPEVKELHDLIVSVLDAHVTERKTANPISHDGISHFHITCAMNHVGAVEFFLKAGADVDRLINWSSPILSGYSALHIAAKYSNLETVQMLLQHGANNKLKTEHWIGMGLTPLHVVMESSRKLMNDSSTADSFLEVKKNNLKANESIALLLMKDGGENGLDFIDDYGLTRLHVACVFKNKSTLNDFLQQDSNEFHVPVKFDSPIWPGFTPLHIAMHCDIEKVKCLLELGANITERDSKGKTPLELCVERYDPATIYSILSQLECFKNIQEVVLSDGRTRLLDVILAMDTSEDFDDLLEKYVSDIDMIIPYDCPIWPGYTLLHLSIAFTKRTEIIENSLYNKYHGRSTNDEHLYLKRISSCLSYNAQVDVQDAYGQTPIHLAFKLEEISVLSLLLNCRTTGENIIDSDNFSYLHIACATARADVVRRLLSCNEDNIDTPVGQDFKWAGRLIHAESTALHIAATFVNEDLIYMLLKRGADPCLQNANLMIPLELIMQNKMEGDAGALVCMVLAKSLENQQYIKYEFLGPAFLKAAAYVNNEELVKELLDGQKICPYFSIVLRYAVDNGCENVVRYMIKVGVELDLMQWKDGAYVRSVDFLLTQYADILLECHQQENVQNLMDSMGLTLLHLACLDLNVPIVEELLQSGVEVNAQTRSDIDSNWGGKTSLHITVSKQISYYGYEDDDFSTIIDLLVEYGADVNIKDSLKYTPLHWAYYNHLIYGNVEGVVNVLLDKQKNYQINPVDPHGTTHLHIACWAKNLDAMEKFLSVPNVDLDHQTDFFAPANPGFTLLHFALYYAYDEAVTLLLDTYKCYEMINAADSDGNTPLHIALKMNRLDWDFISKMLSFGADLNARNARGEIPFELLFKFEEQAIVQYGKLFLTYGCHANTVNPVTSEGLLATALKMYPTMKEAGRVFKMMINAWDIKEIDEENGWNSIQNVVSITSRQRHLPYYAAIERLLEYGCDIDHQDLQGRTALHIAVSRNNYGAVEALLSNGANINICDHSGRSPFHNDPTTDIMNSFLSSHEMIQIFVNQVAMMNYLGFRVLDLTQKVADNIALTRVYQSDAHILRCAEELHGLNLVKTNEFLSMSDFLIRPKESVKYAMDECREESIDTFFKSHDKILREIYPALHGVLQRRYRKAKSLKEAYDVFIVKFHKLLPLPCLEAIFEYL